MQSQRSYKPLTTLLAIFLSFSLAAQPATNQLPVVALSDTLPAPNFPKIGQFQQPQQLASTLATTGLGPFSDWDYVGDYWGASTAEYEFGRSGIKGRKNTLVYHLESTEGNFVKTTKIVLTLNNPAERTAALMRFADLAEKAFMATNLAIPNDLKPALQQGKHFHYEDNTMLITNLYQDGAIGFYTLEITTQ